MSEGIYPLALYRSGSFFEWDGRPTDSCVVNDEDEHLQASEDGWQESADYFADPKTDPETRAAEPRKVRTKTDGVTKLP
jgi:hypothetical protein